MLKVQEGRVSFPKMEEEMVQWWKENNIYEKSLARRENAPAFVFFEGPPTANGMPHPGHCLTRAMKDIFPRYRTMRGYRCERKAGWDTHGLPVELEVCKELGLKKSREEIENYGIEPFIQLCQKSVWRYMQEWEHLTERIGFWIHLDKAYVTYHQSFVESVWWALSEFFKKDLLYQGHKIVWWWAQGGTALSSGEVGEGVFPGQGRIQPVDGQQHRLPVRGLLLVAGNEALYGAAQRLHGVRLPFFDRSITSITPFAPARNTLFPRRCFQ